MRIRSFPATKAAIIVLILAILVQLSCRRHKDKSNGMPVPEKSSIEIGLRESHIDDTRLIAGNINPGNHKSPVNGFGGAPSMVTVATKSLHDLFGRTLLNEPVTYEKPRARKIRRRLSPGDNKIKVYLSFDDGPHSSSLGSGANYTENILNILAKNSVQDGIKAVFFVQTHVDNRGGNDIGRAIIARINEEGHIVGIHSGSRKDHVNHKTRASNGPYDANGDGIVDGKDGMNALEGDMIRASARIFEITGTIPKYVRPTFGLYNNRTESVYERQGLKMILWDVDSGDSLGRYSSGSDLANTLSNKIEQLTGRGETELLILFHDIRSGTQNCLDDYLIAIYEGAQNAGKIAYFATTTAELDDFLSRY